MINHETDDLSTPQRVSPIHPTISYGKIDTHRDTPLGVLVRSSHPAHLHHASALAGMPPGIRIGVARLTRIPTIWGNRWLRGERSDVPRPAIGTVRSAVGGFSARCVYQGLHTVTHRQLSVDMNLAKKHGPRHPALASTSAATERRLLSWCDGAPLPRILEFPKRPVRLCRPGPVANRVAWPFRLVTS
jgi:hypothetical protein